MFRNGPRGRSDRNGLPYPADNTTACTTRRYRRSHYGDPVIAELVVRGTCPPELARKGIETSETEETLHNAVTMKW